MLHYGKRTPSHRWQHLLSIFESTYANGWRRLSVKLAPSYPNRFMPLQHEVLSQMLFSIIAFAFTVYKPQLGL
ncbi:TPA: hypothetical protein EYN09_12710 [Candidatus Poribacteria bacterium]|nr:hypothetical protein [Candidatus Poribacteria bacterium]